MLRRLGIALILVLLSAVEPQAADRVGTGDFEFFLDVAGFKGSDDRTSLEVYVRIPNVQVKFKEVDGRIQGEIGMQLRLEQEDGNVVVDEDRTVRLYADTREEADNNLFYQTVIRKFSLPSGRYRLSCVVRDEYSPKVTVVGIVRGEVKTARLLDVPLDVQDFSIPGVQVSDVKFLWDVEERPDGVLYHPNPVRLYGLYRDSLQVYIEVYVPEVESAALAPLELETEVLDVNGEIVARSASLLEVNAGERQEIRGGEIVYPVIIRDDLNRFPAGDYTLYLNVTAGERLLTRLRGGSFSVAWDLRTWEVSRRHLVAEARFLLDAEDFKGFSEKSIGEQEAIVRAMWKEADPDPQTGVNEAYEKFLERLAYVNARFADYDLGFMTDRGLIYLRYGPPDDLIVDVMPLNRESLSDALQKIEDKFHAVNFSVSGGRIGYAQPSRSIVVDPRRMGAVGEGGDTGVPYELWVYNGSGDPLLERDRALEQDVGLRFIFVDSEGYGRYKLESSSSMTNK